MRAGKLRHQVVIQTPTLSQNPETGEMLAGWAEFATCWAS